MRRAFRPKPVAVFGEGWVPSALQHLHHRLLDKSIQHRRDAKLSHPAVRFRDFHPSHRLRLVGSTLQLFSYGGPVLLQVVREFAGTHPVDPRTPFVCFDSLVSLPAVLPLADLFHQLLVPSWTFGVALRRERFGPFPRSLWSFTPPLLSEGQHQLVLLPLGAHRVMRPLLILPAVWAFIACAITTPAADCRCTIRVVCSTLPSDLASRLGPCASLSLHVHHVVKRTFTSKLSIMLGTQIKAPCRNR